MRVAKQSLKSAVFHRLFDGEGEGGGDGGDEEDFDLSRVLKNPKAKQKITDWAERELVSGVKAKNAELLEKLTKYKTKGENGEEAYIDPERAVRAIQFMDTEGKDIDQKVQSAVKEANERAEGQVKSLNEKLANTEKSLVQSESRRIDQFLNYELKSALLESGIKSGKLPMHQLYLKSLLDVDVDDKGRESIVIKGDDGNMRYGKEGPMTLKEFIEEYREKEDISDDWEADVNSGSGGTGGEPVRRGGSKIDPNLPPAERLRQFRASEAKRKGR